MDGIKALRTLELQLYFHTHGLQKKSQQQLIIGWHCKYPGQMKGSLCSYVTYDLVWWGFGYSCCCATAGRVKY